MSTVEDITRVPPQDLEAEQAVLGSMLLSRDAVMDVIEEGLSADDFYRPAHGTIFTTVVGLHADGEPADPITVKDRLLTAGLLERIGGPAYLHHLVAQVPTTANAAYYAEIVQGKARLRMLVEACNRTLQVCYTAEGDVDEIVDQAGEDLFAATAKRSTGQDWVFMGEAMPEFMDTLAARSEHDGVVTGISTGFADLDSLTGGLKPGQFVVIAARPAMGKSVAAIDFLREFCKVQELPSVIFSLEMGREEIMERWLSAEGRVPLHHLRKGEITDEDWVKVARVAPSMTQAKVIMDDSTNLSALDIRTKSRRIKDQYGLAAIVVDYMQLAHFGGGRSGNRQEEVSAISRSFKLLAKELKVPVIALSQLNRNSTTRENKIPEVSDLRESGSIEQDADIVILLHREDAYNKESPRAGEADFIVAKHRGGPTGTITVAFQGHYARFVDMAQGMSAPPNGY